jgi:nucleoside-diphosphate-sugar epimerase
MNESVKGPVLVTGANGNLGKKLLRALPTTAVKAVVRSGRARADLERWVTLHSLEQVQILEYDYLDHGAMAAAARGCSYAVHLVGVIREVGGNTFHRTHVETTDVLLAALAESGVKKVCYLILAASTPALVLRIPMVLGEGDHASRALLGKARKRLGFGFRLASLEQPIYAGDVVSAIVADIGRSAAAGPGSCGILELAGPECLSRRELIQRAGKVLGTQPRTLSLPLGLGLAVAWLLEKTSASPPVSRAMLGVLDHDDTIDAGAACRELGIELTPLDEMLAHCARDNLSNVS